LTVLLPFALLLLAMEAFGAPASKPVAVVNGEPITGADLKAEFKARHGGHEKFLLGRVEAEKFLELVIDVRLLVQEAYRLDLQDQKDIAESASELAEKKAVERLVKVEVEDKAQPKPEDVKTAWETDTAMLYRARNVVVETKTEADWVLLTVLSGGDFDALARQCSLSPSRQYGGNLPFLGWGSFDPAWEKAVFALEPGETAGPIRTHQGWEVVQLVEVQSVERPDFDKAKAKIEGVLKRRALDERKHALSEFLWAKYGAKRTRAHLSFDGLTAAAKANSEETVATWDGGGKMTVAELLPRLDPGILGPLPRERAAEAIEAEVRHAVDERLAPLEAKARKYEEQPEIADEVKRHREKLMLGALYAEYILKDVKVTDADVKAHFEANRKDFMTPERRRVSHIVLATEEEAKDVKKRLDAGESFADLAKARSTDPTSAKQAGDLGFITDQEVPPDFKGILSLKAGEVSEPMKTKFGWHLVKFTKIEPPRPLTLDEVKGDLKKKLIAEKNREKRAYWVKKLRAAATIKVDDDGIAAFVKDAGID
ncbi:MAG: peptidyl-prolyl cis-trans isomerase, partial [Acidobacteriota bacterium]